MRVFETERGVWSGTTLECVRVCVDFDQNNAKQCLLCFTAAHKIRCANPRLGTLGTLGVHTEYVGTSYAHSRTLSSAIAACTIATCHTCGAPGKLINDSTPAPRNPSSIYIATSVTYAVRIFNMCIKLALLPRWPARSGSYLTYQCLMARSHFKETSAIPMTGCRRYGADTPARQAHVAPVNTRSAKSPKKSQNRNSIVAAAEARASRLQRHMDPETLAKLIKAEGEGSDYQKRYNAAARRWISTIVALPVFIVLSYHLYNRREFWGPHLRK